MKGRSAIKPALSRGIRNDGHVEVDVAGSEDEDREFFEDREYGRVYMLPEKGIILDFISRYVFFFPSSFHPSSIK